MKKFSISIIVAIFSFSSTFGQDYINKAADWGKANWFKPDNEESKTIVKRHDIIELVLTEDDFVEYNFDHRIEYINSHEEVELNNKVYIPYSSNVEIVEAKARVLKENGQSIELDQSKILESYDEETGAMYKYFALEGLEVGNMVEILYVLKRYPDIFGTYTWFQNNYPCSEYTFELITPKHLGFAFDVKRDSNKVNLDTTHVAYNRYYFQSLDIEKLEEEDSAPMNSIRKRLSYKLDANYNAGAKDIVSYEKVSQQIYKRLYKELEKSEMKAIEKLAKQIKLDDEPDSESKVRAVEDYIKSNFNVAKEGDIRFDDLGFAISNKVASAFSITKIFANVYKNLGIEHEVVLTTDRTEIPFDKDFDSYHNLASYLLYFPSIEIYLSPDLFEYRSSLFPAEYASNYGLFIKELVLGDFSTGVGEVKYIPALSYEKTQHNHDVKASISHDFSQVELDLVQTSTGYYANFLQAMLDLVGEDVQKEIGRDVIDGYMEDLDLEEFTFENEGAQNIDRLPLLLKCKAKSTSLIDVAGDQYLFKIGELIGPQVEMYSKTERQHPVHDNYKRAFYRKLVVEIPEGYEVKNLEDLKVYAEYLIDGEKRLVFDSQYKLDGQVLVVEIEEYYDKVSYEASEFEQYRNVVNSASDFNKAVLVLSKK